MNPGRTLRALNLISAKPLDISLLITIGTCTLDLYLPHMEQLTCIAASYHFLFVAGKVTIRGHLNKWASEMWVGNVTFDTEIKTWTWWNVWTESKWKITNYYHQIFKQMLWALGSCGKCCKSRWKGMTRDWVMIMKTTEILLGNILHDFSGFIVKERNGDEKKTNLMLMRAKG